MVSMIAGEVRLGLYLGFGASGGATGAITTGFTGSNLTEVGGRYEDGGWTSVFENQASFAPLPTGWSGEAGASVRVYVRPQLDLVFYTVAGPLIGLEPYLEATGILDSPNWELEVAGGIDARLGFSVEILSRTLAGISRTLEGPRWEVFNGNGQLTGDLRVDVSTTGQDLDPNGFTVVVDETTQQSVSANGSRTFENLPVGSHSVELRDVAGNCAVNGSNPRSVDVGTDGGTALFLVTCEGGAPTADLQVNVTTTGNDLDSDGYTVLLD